MLAEPGDPPEGLPAGARAAIPLPERMALVCMVCGCQGIIIVATSVLNSPRYYLEFLSQVSAITETALRNVSVDSFLYNTLRLFELRPWAGEKITAYALRLLLAIGVLKAWCQLVHRGLFLEDPGSKRVILNSYVLLPVLMLAVSPSIWSHHFVLLTFTMLVLGSILREAWEFWLFVYAYAFIFLFPNYDIYPVSYLRLLALVLLIILLNGAAKRPADSEPEWFSILNHRLAPALAGLFDKMEKFRGLTVVAREYGQPGAIIARFSWKLEPQRLHAPEK